MRDWLYDLRKETGLTMKSLAEKLGISESYYCAIEKGERQKKMDVVLLAGLSAALNVSVAEIVQMESSWAASQK